MQGAQSSGGETRVEREDFFIAYPMKTDMIPLGNQSYRMKK